MTIRELRKWAKEHKLRIDDNKNNVEITLLDDDHLYAVFYYRTKSERQHAFNAIGEYLAGV